VLVFILIKNYKEDFLKNSFKVAVITGLILALSFLVRYENVFIAAVWPLAIAYSVYRLENRKRLWQKISVIYGILLFFVLLAGMFALFYGYGFRIAGSGVNFFSLESPVFYLKRIFHIFFWIDWGLIFTASLLMISLVYLFFIKNRIATTIGILLIPVMFKLYIAVIWRTQGGWYGYRYLVFVLIPLLTIPLAFLIKRILTSKRYRYWMVLLGIISVFPVISMLAFEGNTNLTLSPVIQYFGKSGWGNNYYQLEVWRTLFLRPVEFLIAVLKGGFLYIAYLFFLIFDVKQLLPAQILNQYPVFKTGLLIKTAIIYILPFTLYFITSYFLRHSRIFLKSNFLEKY
jgi:hypothetical protein